MKKAIAKRINYLHVSVQIPGGAPRLFQVKEGDISRRITCQCKNGYGKGCSHEIALAELLNDEATTMTTTLQAAHVVA